MLYLRDKLTNDKNMTRTSFAGLDLKSPIIVGSNSQTASIDKILEFESAGAGAVVLKSLFQESIEREIASAVSDEHPEAYDYISAYVGARALEDYVNLIKTAKSRVSIPVIASIACNTDGKWEEFSKTIEQAGADALELNVMSLCTARNGKPGDFEQMHIDIVEHVCSLVKIPVIVKLGANLSNPVALCDQLYAHGAKAVVLFNRFYPTDIDIEKMSFTTGDPFTNASDLASNLRWAGIVSASVKKLDVAVSGGVQGWEGIVKSVLCGAAAVEVASAIIKNGAKWITEANEGLSAWMKGKSFGAIADFRGKMNASDPENADKLFRTQFLKYFSSVH